MTADEYWSSTFTSQEKLLFQRVCRTLLKKTFIVRDKDDDNRRMYLVLCCLWSLYSDKIKSGSLAKQITVTLADINIELDKYDFNGNIDKGRWIEILGLFAKFNLIAPKGEIGSNDFCIVLFPSLQFALDEKEFADFVNNTEAKFKNRNLHDDYENAEIESPETDFDSFDIEFDESQGDEN